MIIKTKKYQLDKNFYVKICLLRVLREWWWVWAVPAVVLLIPIFYTPALWWCVGLALLLILGYWIFWAIQFVGVTQMPQAKTLFDRMFYEIDSRFVLLKINPNEGMQLYWDKLQFAEIRDNSFIIWMSRGQFLHWPFSIFATELEVKFVENLLRKKNLLK